MNINGYKEWHLLIPINPKQCKVSGVSLVFIVSCVFIIKSIYYAKALLKERIKLIILNSYYYRLLRVQMLISDQQHSDSDTRKVIIRRVNKAKSLQRFTGLMIVVSEECAGNATCIRVRYYSVLNISKSTVTSVRIACRGLKPRAWGGEGWGWWWRKGGDVFWAGYRHDFHYRSGLEKMSGLQRWAPVSLSERHLLRFLKSVPCGEVPHRSETLKWTCNGCTLLNCPDTCCVKFIKAKNTH